MEFRNRLAILLEGESVTQVAHACGMAHTTLNKYLKGVSLPGLENLIALTRYFEINIAWLATGEGPKKGTYSKPPLPQKLVDKKHPFAPMPSEGLFCIEFGENLRQLREAKEHSEKEAAECLHVNIEDIKAMECGYLPCSNFLLGTLCRYLDCNPGRLLYKDYFKRPKYTSSDHHLYNDIIEHTREPNPSEIKKLLIKNKALDPLALHTTEVFMANDSTMSPTINDGDYAIVTIVEHFNFSGENGLYLVEFNGWRAIRRITNKQHREFVLGCDNEFYNSYDISIKDLEDMVKGKVQYIVKANF